MLELGKNATPGAVGMFGEQYKNVYGESLIIFAISNDLQVTNTSILVRKKDINKYIWSA